MNENKTEMTLCELLRKRQLGLEFSIRALAQYSKISRPTLLKLLNPNAPKSIIRPQTISKLYNNLNIPLKLIDDYNMEALREETKRKCGE